MLRAELGIQADVLKALNLSTASARRDEKAFHQVHHERTFDRRSAAKKTWLINAAAAADFGLHRMRQLSGFLLPRLKQHHFTPCLDSRRHSLTSRSVAIPQSVAKLEHD